MSPPAMAQERKTHTSLTRASPKTNDSVTSWLYCSTNSTNSTSRIMPAASLMNRFRRVFLIASSCSRTASASGESSAGLGGLSRGFRITLRPRA